MIFARPCRHFDGILGKTYTYSGFYLESEKKVVPEFSKFILKSPMKYISLFSCFAHAYVYAYIRMSYIRTKRLHIIIQAKARGVETSYIFINLLEADNHRK